MVSFNVLHEHLPMLYGFLTNQDSHNLQSTCWRATVDYRLGRELEWGGLRQLALPYDDQNHQAECEALAALCDDQFQQTQIEPLQESPGAPKRQRMAARSLIDLRNLRILPKTIFRINHTVSQYLARRASFWSEPTQMLLTHGFLLFREPIQQLFENSKQLTLCQNQEVGILLNAFHADLTQGRYEEAAQKLLLIKEVEAIRDKWTALLPHLAGLPNSQEIIDQIADPEIIYLFYLNKINESISQYIINQNQNVSPFFDLWNEISSTKLTENFKNRLFQEIILPLQLPLWAKSRDPKKVGRVMKAIKDNIHNQSEQDYIINALVTQHLRFGSPRIAKKMTRHLHNPELKNQQFKLVCEQYIQQNQLSKAEESALEIQDTQHQSDVYRKLSEAYLYQDSYEKAQEMAFYISDPKIQEEYYETFCPKLVQLGLEQAALLFIECLTAGQKKYELMKKIGAILENESPIANDFLQNYEAMMMRNQEVREECLSFATQGNTEGVLERIHQLQNVDEQIETLYTAIQLENLNLAVQNSPLETNLAKQMIYCNEILANMSPNSKKHALIVLKVTQGLVPRLTALLQTQGFEATIKIIKTIKSEYHQDQLIQLLADQDCKNNPNRSIELLRFLHSSKTRDLAFLARANTYYLQRNWELAIRFGNEIEDIKRQSAIFHDIATSLFTVNAQRCLHVCRRILDPQILSETLRILSTSFARDSQLPTSINLAKQIPLWNAKTRAVSEIILAHLSLSDPLDPNTLLKAIELYRMISNFKTEIPTAKAFAAIVERATRINHTSPEYEDMLKQPPLVQVEEPELEIETDVDEGDEGDDEGE